MKQFINIFDLDHTLIDSSHRMNPDGDVSKGVELDYWLSKSTEEMIMKDELLPLVDLFREFKKTNFTNIAVTAREMLDADFKYLEKNDLEFNMILHREDSKELDHVMKEKRIMDLFEKDHYIPFMAFDDKVDNLKIFENLGFRCFNAELLNNELKRGKKLNLF